MIPVTKYCRMSWQKIFIGMSDVVKNKSLEYYARHLCRLELIEFERLPNKNNTRHCVYVLDSPDTAIQIVNYVRKYGHESGIVKKVDVELCAIYLEMEKILKVFENREVIDALLADGVRRVNVKKIIPFLEWLDNGIETEHGKVFMSFYHLKYMVLFASRRMREICEEYSTCKGKILSRGYLLNIRFYYYPYNWITSPHLKGEFGKGDDFAKFLEDVEIPRKNKDFVE